MTSKPMKQQWEDIKKKRLEFIKYCGDKGIGSVLMMDELFLAFDWFYSELSQAKAERTEEIIQIIGKYSKDSKDVCNQTLGNIIMDLSLHLKESEKA